MANRAAEQTATESRFLGEAIFSRQSRDLFWRLWVNDEDGVLMWVGYDDERWWEGVALSEQFQIQIGKSGWMYFLDPHTDRVYELR